MAARGGALRAAERSYLKSEVRGSGLECQAATAQERPRGSTLCPRSGAEAERSYMASEVRGGGQEETPRVRGQGQQPGGAILCPRSGAAGRNTLCLRSGVTGRSHLTPEAKGGSWEETPRTRGQGR